jgi:hypothetical protein
MQILSTIDAVSPAIARTKLVLYTPFRAGRTWKLSASAYLSFSGTLFFPFPFIYLIFIPQLRTDNNSGLITLLIAAVLCGTLLYTFIFYLCSRMHFVFFDIVLNRGEFVAPAWRKYGPQTWRWTLVKMALGTVMVAAMAVPLAVYFRHLIEIMQRMSTLKPGEPPPPELFFAIFAGYGIVLLLGGSFFLIVATLDSLIVPSLALENINMGEAFRRVGNLIRYEPGQFFLYILVKIGIGLAGYMGLTIALEIAALIVGLVIAIIVGVIGFLLHLIGVPTALLFGLGIFVAVVFYIVTIFYGMVLAMGPLFTFMQAYTLYFLGGRYPLLGELIERSTPPPVAPSMPPPSYMYPPPPSGSAP